jgi:hypothetical protein
MLSYIKWLGTYNSCLQCASSAIDKNYRSKEMQENILNDFLTIYKNTIDDKLLKPLVNHIESILIQYRENVKLETRNDKGEFLGYFTFKAIDKKKTVIFAGGRDHDASGKKRPSIRFRNNNSILSQIPDVYKYPFQRDRKEIWTCVEIHRDTVNYFPLLMDYEVEVALNK